ncbi:MAG TPA: hypothetical protein VL485_21425 [Ktedonobacteraceae bacterium]|jgi:hypothetical protein|nr:hypothetical protein [Ktedonobacteraceae bacterium]
MPMTPAHQRLIAEVVQHTIARTLEMLQLAGLAPQRVPTAEQQDACALAKA